MRLYLLDKVGFRLCAYEFVHYLSAFDEQNGGNAGNAIVDRKLGGMIDIDLAYIDLAIVFLRQFFNDRADRAARTTPFSPEVNNSQLVAVDHLVLEIGIR